MNNRHTGVGLAGGVVTSLLVWLMPLQAVPQGEPAVPLILPDPAQTVLQRDVGFSAGQLVLVRNGQIVVKLLASPEPKEVAVAGAVRVTISKEEFFARYRDIERFKRHKAVLQLGRFSPSPRMEDVGRLTFAPDSIDDLRDCRPGRCQVKLPDAWIEDIRRGIDFNATSWRDAAQHLLRQKLVDYVTAYQSSGTPALVEYHDDAVPVRLADQFAGIVKRSTYFEHLFPDLGRYLLSYPHGEAEVIDSFVYWSQEEFGLKPVVSVTHVSVYQDRRQPGAMVGVSKQIFANHYFESSLGFTMAVDDGNREKAGIYLVYVNRSIADALQGSFGGVRRSMVFNRTKAGVEQTLRELKQMLESGAR